MEIINYIFYISYLRYKKEDSTIFTAVLHVSLIEYMFLCGIILLTNAVFCPKILFFKYFFNSLGTMKLYVLLFCFTLMFINYLYFKSKVSAIEEKYKNYRKMKAHMFFIIDILILLLAIIIFKIRNYYRI